MSENLKARPASAVVVYSGGLDSTVLLYSLIDDGIVVSGALSVDYGQKHSKELAFAAKNCAELGIEHNIADLRSIASIFGKSSLTNTAESVPEGHYEEVQMKSTVVPNRNMILMAIATSWAISLKADVVAYGAHGGDHAIYPDCREEFALAMDEAIKICDWHKLELYRPFVELSKADIVKEGARLKVPFAGTWSCYKGGDTHCGRCGTCVERREAFYLAGVEDPTIYDPTAPSVDELLRTGWSL